MKEIINNHKKEISIYLTAGALLLAAYLIIGKFMPIILACRVIID